MKVTNLESPYDAAIQSQQIDDAIAQKYDLIVLDYINDQAILPALTRAKAAGMPVVLMATPLQKAHEDLFLSYIGTEHEELGRIAGENLVRALAAEGKTTAKVVGDDRGRPATSRAARMAAFNAVRPSIPASSSVAQEDGKWNTAGEREDHGRASGALCRKGGIDGIFAMADNQATGAIQAVEVRGAQAGRQGQGHRRRCQQLHEGRHHPHQSGEQYSTATQIPTEEAAFAAKKIAGYFNGEPLKKYEIVKSYGITSENVDKFAQACSY